ncbi:MAG: YggS family pyridoxal phosphate-dependent enzyme [Candidatus Omnitrophota bacterium]
MPETIAGNIKSVTERMARCCEKSGRPRDCARLIVVTKAASVLQAEEAMRSGACDLGENRVQDALVKYRAIGDRVKWHLIGHLQTNKVRDAVGIFSLIHSVDSIKLARAIDKEAAKAGKRQSILIQVNVSGEDSKFGIPPGDAAGFLKEASAYPNISIEGLMTIAPESADPEASRPHFRKLRELRDAIRNTQYAIRTLSMGMTNDFEAAIEEGSTIIRVGRAIFGPPSLVTFSD